MPNSSAVNIALAKKSKIVGGSVALGGVRIATVTAMHSNGVDYIGGDLGKAMQDAGIAGDVGLATGVVLRFSNGLVAHLSGDTGIAADHDRVVRQHDNAKLAMMDIGDGFSTGPAEPGADRHGLCQPAASGGASPSAGLAQSASSARRRTTQAASGGLTPAGPASSPWWQRRSTSCSARPWSWCWARAYSCRCWARSSHSS